MMREQILALLERNSKLQPEEIAVLLGSGADLIRDEIRKMEEERIICGYNTLINWDQAGADKVTALIEVRVTPQRGQGFDNIAERIARALRSAMSCSLTPRAAAFGKRGNSVLSAGAGERAAQPVRTRSVRLPTDAAAPRRSLQQTARYHLFPRVRLSCARL